MLCLLLNNCSLLFSQHFQIGDVVINSDGSKGIMFYVHPNGLGGWMVALDDASNSCKWGAIEEIDGLNNYSQNTTEPLLTNELNGKENTRIIRNAQNNDTTYAAGKVDFENGWYLPSIGQLRILYSKWAIIENSLIANGGVTMNNKDYWSSTQHGSRYVKVISYNSDGGNYTITEKKNRRAVRAIRDFSLFQWNTGDVSDSIVVSPSETTTYSVTVMEGGMCPYDTSITVMVNPLEYVVIDTTVCDSFEWHDSIYTTSGVYTFINNPDAFCQAFDTLYLTVSGDFSVSIEADDEACEGDSIVLHATISPALIGDILCTDGTFVHPDEWSPHSGKTAKGVVFYVDRTGRHGWAVDLQDQSGMARWCTSAVAVRGLTNCSTAREAMLDINGYRNTMAIRSVSSTGVAQFPAACQLDIDEGWYLPAMGQLRYMYAYIYTINHSLEILGKTPFKDDAEWSYWTSTQYDENEKWVMGHTGNVNNIKGTTEQMVRGVCSF